MSDDDNNVVQFPAGKPRVVQHESVEVPAQANTVRVPGRLDHMMFTDSGKPAEASVCTIVAVLTFVICWIWFVIALAL